MQRYCKLSDYAKHYGVTYRTAFNRYHKEEIEGTYMDDTGHVRVPIEHLERTISNDVIIYATVPSKTEQNKIKLNNQIELIQKYCNSKGYNVVNTVSEYSSTIVDARPKLMKLIEDKSCKHIVCENKSSITRFGVDYIQKLMEIDNRELEFMNTVETDRETVTKDFIKVIYNVCKELGGKTISKSRIKLFLDKLIFSMGNENLDEL